MRIYISHSSEDKQIAKLISDRLINEGFVVLMDTMTLKSGDNLINKINLGLKSADVILALFSKSSIKSKWAQYELESIIFGDISSEKKRIIPVRLDKALLPSSLMNYQWIDLSRYDIEFGLNNLCKALGEGIKKRKTTKEDYRVKNEVYINKKKWTGTKIAFRLSS